MYDLPHPCYLDHNQKGRSKPLNQDFHDGNPTCKHDFIDLEPLSRFRSHISIVMFFGIPPLMLILLLYVKRGLSLSMF